MRTYLKGSVLAFAAAAVLCAAAPAQTDNAGKNNGAMHDLSGIWLRQGPVPNMGKDVTWTPEGKAAFDANKPSFGPRQVPPALGNDPMGTCDPLGMPRNAFVEEAARSVEFLPVSGRVLEFFEWQHQYRTIWTDGRQLPKEPDPRWNGYAIGKWVGDTFVVDSVGFDDRTWLDMYGDPHSDALQVQERFRRVDHDTLTMVITFTDPKYFTQTWTSPTITFKMTTEKTTMKGMDDKEETFCVPTEEEAFNKRIRDAAVGTGTK